MDLSSILVALFVFSMIVVALTRNQSRATQLSNFFNIFIALLLVLTAAVRNEIVGSDTPNYIDDYELVKMLPFTTIVSDYFSLSLVYYSVSWLAAKIGLSRWVWFGIVEAFYVFTALFFVNKFSKDRVFSFFCFVTIGLFFPSYCIMKQIVAMSFSLLSYYSFTEKRTIRAFLYLILGFFSHQSIIIFIFAFFVYYFKSNKRILLFFTLAIIVLTYLGSAVWDWMISGYGNEHYTMYQESDEVYSNVTFIYLITLFLITFFIKGNYYKLYRIDCSVLLVLSLFACTIQSLSTSFSIAHRLAYYYMPFMIILIPNIVSCVNNKFTQFVYKSMYVIMMSFFLIYTQREVPYLIDLRILNMF